MGIERVSTFIRLRPSVTQYSCQPSDPTTVSPTANFGLRETSTTPTVPPIIVSPSACGSA